MDSIDQALITAWHTVSARLHASLAEAARRFARAQSPAMRRPVRPWCLRLRASDTRIDSKFWNVAPELTPTEAPWPLHPPHELIIGGPALRDLMRPVSIDWPGIDWTHAAERLGRHPESIRGWIKRGLFTVKRHPARSVHKIGNPVPFIWSKSLIDPNMGGGPRPQRAGARAREWGESWMTLHERIPDAFGQLFRRHPVFRTCGKDPRPRFRGWHFECPGRMLPLPSIAAKTARDTNATAAARALEHHRAKHPRAALFEKNGRTYIHLPCDRRVDSLFCPMPVWTIARWLGDDQPLIVGEEPIAGTPLPRVHIPGSRDTILPGLEDWSADFIARRFACHHCWQIRYCSSVDRNGWNLLVSHLTGGLLRGQDVPRPADLARPRLRPYRMQGPVRVVPIPPATIARRKKVLALLLQGHTYQHIADTTDTSYITTAEDIRVIYKSHKVRTRKQLLSKLMLTH